MKPTTSPIQQILMATSRFATFLGVTQQTFETVWGRLTGPDAKPVAYISMEIGADPDVYNPVADHFLIHGGIPESSPDFAQLRSIFLAKSQKIPNYSGGLGILAGDTLKSFADCKLPVVAVSLLYREGYFSQIVDSQLGQISIIENWSPENTACLYKLHSPANPDKPFIIEVPFFLENDQELILSAQVWIKMEINHRLDYFVPEILLDFDQEDTPKFIRSAATQLYNAESSITKAIQRRMLGTGILPALRALGIEVETYHLNEQHGVVLAMQLIAEDLHLACMESGDHTIDDTKINNAANQVAKKLVYTIHTPVKAGHDRFSKNLYRKICSTTCRQVLDILAYDEDFDEEYNFTNMAMRVNRSANSVSRLHRDVTHKQFPQFASKISAITNGVHHLTWISKERALLFDTTPALAGWRDDPGVFKNIVQIKNDEVFRSGFLQAWKRDTKILIHYINGMLRQHRAQMTETWIDPPNFLSMVLDAEELLQPDCFTIGFARRFSTYKRADLIFHDIDMLSSIILDLGKSVNFIFAGKAHPADEPGKTVLKDILDKQEELYRKTNGLAKLVFIPGYDMNIAKILVSGVHAWLNCPKRPLEASGTSGMKAAMNGVPNISIMDGWWVEGFHNGQTGYKFGHEGPIDSTSLSESREELLYFEDSSSFYRLLPKVLEAFHTPDLLSPYIDKCIMNLCLNIPVFNTHRMAAEYIQRYHIDLPEEQMKEMRQFAELYSSDI